MSNPKLAIIYARVSTNDQREEGFSLDAQLKLLREYCQAKGLTVVQEFTESQSARSGGRRQFAKALAMVKAGIASHFVVEKLDRLTRNFLDLAEIEGLVQEGLTLHCVKDGEPITSESGSQARFMLGIKAVIAKNFSDNLSEEARKGMTEKAVQGGWPTVAPPGYINVKRHGRNVIEPDPDQAPLIKDMFEEFASGRHSIKSITSFAQAIGIKSSHGRPISRSRVHTLLSHSIYIGKVPWKGAEYPGSHEPIVSDELFARVQSIINSDRPKTKSRLGEYIFRGVAVCGVCGCMASPYAKKGHVYYACTGAKGCRRLGVREEAIDEAFIDVLSGMRIRPETLETLTMAIKEAHGDQAAEAAEQRQRLVAEKSKVMAKLKNIIDERFDNRILEEAFVSLQNDYSSQVSELNAKIERLDRADLQSWTDQANLVRLVSNQADLYQTGSIEQKQRIARSVLSNLVIVDKKPQLTVKPWFKTLLELNKNHPLLLVSNYRGSEWQG